jgi:hypothetical protein
MFFAEMCLKNPEIPSEQIYKAILDERLRRGSDNNYFKKIIRGYTCFINNKMAKYFSQILGSETTSEKLHSYHKKKDTGIEPPEMTVLLDKLNYLISKEAYPEKQIDITDNKMLKNTLKKYTKFKKTIRKSTSSTDLSSKERESRHHMKQLKQSHTSKMLEFIDRRTAKDKEKKATEKIRKAEEKEEAKIRKAEEKERKAMEEKQRKAEEKERKATEKSFKNHFKEEEKFRKAEEKRQKTLEKEEKKLASKTAKSKPKTTKAKTFKTKSQSEPNDI